MEPLSCLGVGVCSLWQLSLVPCSRSWSQPPATSHQPPRLCYTKLNFAPDKKCSFPPPSNVLFTLIARKLTSMNNDTSVRTAQISTPWYFVEQRKCLNNAEILRLCSKVSVICGHLFSILGCGLQVYRGVWHVTRDTWQATVPSHGRVSPVTATQKSRHIYILHSPSHIPARA